MVTPSGLGLVSLRSAPRTLLALWAACILWVSPSWAGQAFVQLEPDTLSLGQTGRMTLLLVGERPNAQPRLAAPDGATLTFDSSYQQFRSDGYQRTLVFGFRYRVTPTREGTVEVGPFTLKMSDGSEVTTQAVTLNVLPPVDSVDEVDPIRVVSGFGVSEAWEGQVLLYSLEMTARVRVLGLNWRIGDFPSLTQPAGVDSASSEFVIEEGDQQITINRLVIPYVATGIGPLPRTAPVASVNVGTGRRGIFGLQQYKTTAVAGDTVDLSVRALPPPPPNFTGLVGDVKFRSRLERDVASVGSSIKWTLDVVGDANLDGWKPPELQKDLPIAVYAGDTVVEARIQQGGLFSQGRIDRVLVPTEPGKLDLGVMELVTFSPTRGDFVTHRVPVGTLQVGGGEEIQAEIQSFAPPLVAALAEEGPGFRAPYSWGWASRFSPRFPLILASAISALPAAYLGLMAVVGRMRRRLRDRAQARHRPPTARELLRSLPADPMERLAALDMVLRQALATRAGVEPSELNRNELLKTLPEPLARQIEEVTRCLDRARFASGDSEGVGSDVTAIVAELEAL